MNKQNEKFGREYFTGYYEKNVGVFEDKDLERSINWFYGWISYLNKFVDLKYGKSRKVLEIGCSIGGVSHILSDAGFEVFASDISEYAVERARKLSRKLKKNISFSVFDIEKNIPLRQKFDLIIVFEVIEHLQDPFGAIKKMRTKLKKNGTLICSTPDKDFDLSSDPTHINVKRRGEWRRIFRKAGFKKLQLEQISFVPFFWRLNKRFHIALPLKIKSRFINSPLFIIAINDTIQKTKNA